jgi:hypothetical protein
MAIGHYCTSERRREGHSLVEANGLRGRESQSQLGGCFRQVGRGPFLVRRLKRGYTVRQSPIYTAPQGTLSKHYSFRLMVKCPKTACSFTHICLLRLSP